MKKIIVVGSECFDEFIKEDGYYVDKTELIYELAANTCNKVTLFTRPRRFGKTLTMSMMENFFDIRRDSREVFDGLRVMAHSEFCGNYMNRFPTLFLTFKSIDGLNFEKAYGKLKGLVSEVCIKYADLSENESVDPADRAVFERLKFKTADDEEIQNSLKTLTRMLYAAYGKPVILLMDEYDVPLAKASERNTPENRYYEQMLDVIRGMFDAALKTNEYLKFAVVTGCLRISKESIFTGVNNFASYSVTDRRFSRYFGFTQGEVEEMLRYVQLSDKLDTVREWYDGYIFGDSEVFCPWDVVNYVSAALYDNEEEPQNFWANTSGNAILNDFISHPQFNVSEKFETLLNGGTIAEELVQELTYDQLSASEKNLWSVLLMTGYVSKADKENSKRQARLRIPNTEVAGLFRDAVVARFHQTLDASKADALILALWTGDEKAASSALTDILWNSISYNDYAENYYHGVLNDLFASRGYQVDSNDESGLGRLDLRVKDRANRRVIVIELKRSKKEGNLEKDCEDAIGQIVKKGYAKMIPEGYGLQICYGIAFYAKTAWVKKM